THRLVGPREFLGIARLPIAVVLDHRHRVPPLQSKCCGARATTRDSRNRFAITPPSMKATQSIRTPIRKPARDPKPMSLFLHTSDGKIAYPVRILGRRRSYFDLQQASAEKGSLDAYSPHGILCHGA